MKKKIFVKISKSKNNRIVNLFKGLSQTFIDACENMNNDHRSNGEQWLQKKIAEINPVIIFDVGANKGEWSIAMAKISPPSRIYAFEPVKEVYDQLISNTSNTTIKCNLIALSNKNGESSFFQNNKQSLFSSLYQRHNENLVEVKVQTVKGDTFCNESNISTIDFLKIDVEGAELEVINGFAEKLKTSKIKIIQFEYGPMNIHSRALLYDFYMILGQYGYNIGKLYPHGIKFKDYSYDQENFRWGNFVAVLKSENQLIKHLKY